MCLIFEGSMLNNLQGLIRGNKFRHKTNGPIPNHQKAENFKNTQKNMSAYINIKNLIAQSPCFKIQLTEQH